MKRLKRCLLGLSAMGVLMLTGCALNSEYAVADPNMRSVLIVPMINETNRVGADTLMLATSSMPLAERGYYVFPVDTVKTVLEHEGLYEPERVRQVPPAQLAAMFDADAVMFVKIVYWDALYLVFNTRTSVKAEYDLYNRAGRHIWHKVMDFYVDSNQGGGNILVEAICAAVNRAAPDFKTLAVECHSQVAKHWLPGPYARAGSE